MKLTYRYDKLDRLHEYQLDNDKCVFSQWVWYYLGKYLNLHKDERFLPYLFEPTKIIGTYIGRSAKQRADYIIKSIIRHRKNRKLRSK